MPKTGMDLQNHSYTHQDLSKQTEQVVIFEVSEAQVVLTQAFGKPPRLFRCPYGSCGALGRQAIANEGLVHVFWTVDSLDWQDRNPDSIYARVLKQMNLSGRGIILFHDVHEQSVVASKMVSEYLQDGVKKGAMRVLTVEQAMDELNSSEGMK